MSKGTAPKAYENGNWQCYKCFNVNYAYRTECNRCKEPRGTAVDSYAPGYMTNWDCPKCGNVNYPRRTKCNRCAEPRPTEPAISSSPYSPPQYSSPISLSSLDLNMDYKLKLAHQFLSLFSNEINPMDSAVKCLMAVENWQSSAFASPTLIGHMGSLSPPMGPLSYDSKEGGGLSPLTTDFLDHSGMKPRRRTGTAPVAGVDGNWKCSDASCGNVNFPKRTHCNRCHKERTVEQAQLAELFLKQAGTTSPESGSTPASPVSVSGVSLALANTHAHAHAHTHAHVIAGSGGPGGPMHPASAAVPIPNGASHGGLHGVHNAGMHGVHAHAGLVHTHGGMPHSAHVHSAHGHVLSSSYASDSDSGSPIGSLANLGHNVGSPLQSDGGLLDAHDSHGVDDELHAHTHHSVSDPGAAHI